MVVSNDTITTSFPDLAGQFTVTHTVDEATGYTQLCVTVRDRHAPIVVVDGVRGDVHVGVYDDGPPTRIDRNGRPT